MIMEIAIMNECYKINQHLENLKFLKIKTPNQPPCYNVGHTLPPWAQYQPGTEKGCSLFALAGIPEEGKETNIY